VNQIQGAAATGSKVELEMAANSNCCLEKEFVLEPEVGRNPKENAEDGVI